jgi:hypothetical protein
MIIKDFGQSLGTSKMLDAKRRGTPTEAYKHTPQGEPTEGNTADDSLMVDQG